MNSDQARNEILRMRVDDFVHTDELERILEQLEHDAYAEGYRDRQQDEQREGGGA